MDIVARPRRGRHRWLARLLLVFVVVLVIAVLAPTALGLQRHAVTDDAMSGDYARGTLVLGEAVPAADLEVGDVVTFRAPVGAGGETWVTRRIVDIEDDRLQTGGDSNGAVDPWLVAIDGSELWQVSYAIPWLGYPWQVFGAAAPVFVGLFVAGLLFVVVRIRRRARLAGGARARQRPGSPSDAPATLA